MAQYYLAKNGQKAGPFTIEQLVQNGLTPESLVFTQGMTAWTKASEVAELASILKPTPAPQPAPAAPAPAPAPQPQYQAPQPQYQQPYQQPAMGNYVATPQMDFVTAVKTCLQKYFNFKGRARRSEFWWFMLATYIFNSVVNGILYSIMGGLLAKKEALKAELTQQGLNSIMNGGDLEAVKQAAESQDPTTTIIILGILMFIVSVVIFIPQLSAMVRRLHDVGKSGNILWLYLLCGIGGIIGLILCIPEGKPEPNKYGESPKFKLQQ